MRHIFTILVLITLFSSCQEKRYSIGVQLDSDDIDGVYVTVSLKQVILREGQRRERTERIKLNHENNIHTWTKLHPGPFKFSTHTAQVWVDNNHDGLQSPDEITQCSLLQPKTVELKPLMCKTKKRECDCNCTCEKVYDRYTYQLNCSIYGKTLRPSLIVRSKAGVYDTDGFEKSARSTVILILVSALAIMCGIFMFCTYKSILRKLKRISLYILRGIKNILLWPFRFIKRLFSNSKFEEYR